MSTEIRQFLINPENVRLQILVAIMGFSTGLSFYGIAYFNSLVFTDLFIPTLPWIGFGLLGICFLYPSWLLYSIVFARFTRRPVSEILYEDAYTYLPLVMLLGAWLKHLGFMSSFTVIFASACVMGWKVWNLNISVPSWDARRTEKWCLGIVLVAMLGYMVTFSILSGLRVYAFQTYGDFSAMIQPIWGFGRFQMLFMTQLGNAFWGAHFWPTLVLLGPIYRLYEDPVTLVVIQSVMLGLGAIPVYLIARDRLQTPIMGVVFALLYVLYPAIQLPNLADFHESLLTPPLLLFTLYYLDKQKYLLSFIFVVLALGCKEDVSIAITMIGFYTLVVKRIRGFGLLLTGVGTVWFFVVVFMVIPYFSEGDPLRFVQSSPLSSGGTSEGILPRIELAMSQIFTISNTMNAVHLMLPMGFLALLGPLEAMMGVLPFVELLVYTGPPFGFVGSISSWHITTVVPFVFFAAIAGTGHLIRWLRQYDPALKRSRAISAIVTVLLVCGIGSNAVFGAVPFSTKFDWRPYRVTDHVRVGHEMLELIPAGVPVSATNAVIAYLSHRTEVYQFPNPFIRVDWLSDRRKPVQPVYVLLDTAATTVARMHLSHQPAYRDDVRMILTHPDYEVFTARDGYVILKKRPGISSR